MTITTGTPKSPGEHSWPASLGTLAVGFGTPLVLGVMGLALHGWEAINWTGAVVWGAVASAGMSAFMETAYRIGLTRMSLLEMFGSSTFAPGTTRAWVWGTFTHLIDGAVLRVAYAYAMALFGWEISGVTGLF